MGKFNKFLTNYVTLPAAILAGSVGSVFGSSSTDINKRADDIFLNQRNNIETVLDGAQVKDTISASYSQLPEIMANQGRALSGFLINKDYKESGNVPFRFDSQAIDLSDMIRYSESSNLPAGLSNDDFSFNVIPLTPGVTYDGSKLNVPTNHTGDVLADVVIKYTGNDVLRVSEMPDCNCTKDKEEGDVIKSLKGVFVRSGESQGTVPDIYIQGSDTTGSTGPTYQTVMIPSDSLMNVLKGYDGRFADIASAIDSLRMGDECCDSLRIEMNQGFTNVSGSLDAINETLTEMVTPKGHIYVGALATSDKGFGGVAGYQSNNTAVAPFIEGRYITGENLTQTTQEINQGGFGSEDRINTNYVIDQRRVGINVGLDVNLLQVGNLSLHLRGSAGGQYISGVSSGTTEVERLEGFEGFPGFETQTPEVTKEKYTGIGGIGSVGAGVKFKNLQLGFSMDKATGTPYPVFDTESINVIDQSKSIGNKTTYQLKAIYHINNNR